MYKNNNKSFNNNQLVFSSLNNTDIIFDNSEDRNKNISIDSKIDSIFNASNYIYKADVKIVTDKEVLYKRIVGRNNSNLITIDGEYIPISIIRDIYR